MRTWTEPAAAIGPWAVLTQRARVEACRRVGKDAHAVAAVARDLPVGWATIMGAVHEHGTALVEDPGRLDGVATLGLEETSFHEGDPGRAHPMGDRPGRPGARSAAGLWWPTAPEPRLAAGSAPSLQVGWPGWRRSRWTPGAAT